MSSRCLAVSKGGELILTASAQPTDRGGSSTFSIRHSDEFSSRSLISRALSVSQSCTSSAEPPRM